MPRKKKLLFVAENITLAQVVRLVSLANGLNSNRYDVHFACSQFPELIFGDTQFEQHTIETLDPAVASRALLAGKRLYEKSTLLRYIRAERTLIDAIRPDLTIGDFRLSLPTSSELCGVASAVLINAYWSPYVQREKFPVPDHPILKVLGERLTEQYFPLAIDKVFKHFAAPLNAVRKKHGLPGVGSLLQMLTHASHTLYPDDPELFTLQHLPASHHFLGPVLWEPRVEGPELVLGESSKPLVYATLGSSGHLATLPLVIEALGQMDIRAVVATAGRTQVQQCPANVQIFDYLPGEQLCQQASVVISNGGSTTGYQALHSGTPVVGIPSNLDQFLSSELIARSGAGTIVKAREASVQNIVAAVTQVLESDTMRRAAARVATRFQSLNSATAFEGWLAQTVD